MIKNIDFIISSLIDFEKRFNTRVEYYNRIIRHLNTILLVFLICTTTVLGVVVKEVYSEGIKAVNMFGIFGLSLASLCILGLLVTGLRHSKISNRASTIVTCANIFVTPQVHKLSNKEVEPAIEKLRVNLLKLHGELRRLSDANPNVSHIKGHMEELNNLMNKLEVRCGKQ